MSMESLSPVNSLGLVTLRDEEDWVPPAIWTVLVLDLSKAWQRRISLSSLISAIVASWILNVSLSWQSSSLYSALTLSMASLIATEKLTWVRVSPEGPKMPCTTDCGQVGVDSSEGATDAGCDVRDRSSAKLPNGFGLWGMGDITSSLHGADIPAVVV
jgi:hypothetical protein